METDANGLPRDEASAHEFGRRVGKAAGERASSKILLGLSISEARAVGAEELRMVIEHADSMIAAGISADTVAAWTKAVGDAFSAELESVTKLLKAREASTSRH